MFNSFNKQAFPNSNWVDFSKESILIGWSTVTTKILLYKIVSDTIYVIYRIEGTSNSTNTYFTIPVQTTVEQEKVISGGIANPSSTNTGIRYYFPCIAVDNNVTRDGFVWVFKSTSGTTIELVNFYEARKGLVVYAISSANYSTWTATGTKTINGQFFMPL